MFQCRICKSRKFVSIIDLGVQHLTGFFPKETAEKVQSGRLNLVICETCRLVQLLQSPDVNEMYGMNYGYRSSLNLSMVRHLNAIIQEIESINVLKQGDVVVDIGSNDGTLLSKYSLNDKLTRIGVDPTIAKFKKYYDKSIITIPYFFSSDVVNSFINKKAKVITSIAMFYDLEDPVNFVKEIEKCLDADGIWCFEQSYLPMMLSNKAFDTICHEHLEYYTLQNILDILDKTKLEIFDFQTNDVNGGSIRIYARFSDSIEPSHRENSKKKIKEEIERTSKVIALENLQKFSSEIVEFRGKFIELVRQIKLDYDLLIGVGASTKGNVLLQYCGFTVDDIEFIVDLNEDKFNKFTPGSRIPIKDERVLLNYKDKKVLGIVLPWHFGSTIIERYRFEYPNVDLLFPLPTIAMYKKGVRVLND